MTEFTAKRGDLDLRFTPAPTAQEGIAGHAVVAGRRPAGYECEITLSGEYKHLLVRGRADGYDPAHNRLEEVKTHRGDLDRLPANHRALHWAQLKIYGWLLCQARSLQEVELALVYFDIGSQKETMLAERHTEADLRRFFEQQCECFLEWAQRELEHRSQRDAALTGLAFPHSSFRPGQRQLAEAVYRAASNGRCLMVQAPTGIGKTVGTLFPMLKACPSQKLDKIFYLAAKTSGRGLALEALERIGNSAPTLPLRILELTARDKACEHPDKACHGESCPLAQGFYDRLPAARQAAVEVKFLDKHRVRDVAAEHQVCPYYLAQDLARWSDVVVGDYNYYFDASAMLHGMTLANQWQVGVLVDEAHNLVERARKMYSAELDQAALRQLRRTAPGILQKPLDRLNRQWNAMHKEQTLPYEVHADVPEKFSTALQQAITEITEYFIEHPATVDQALQRFYFDALHFSRLLEAFGKHSLFDISKTSPNNGAASGSTGNAVLCLRNIIPAPFLDARFAASRTTTLFSATLSPWYFYSDMLGMPATTVCVDVESPFTAEQLSVQIVSRISTRYQHRERSVAPIASLLAERYAGHPGNYLAFFSSFDYMRKVADQVHMLHPEIPSWTQERQMQESEKEAFLDRFAPGGRGIGFAVLGGAFAEGVDLPGDRLVGAFIATLGLPQYNPVNEQIRQRMDAVFGAGYDYAYLYPGLQKVVQAAGRVIRTQTDRGVVFLIDDRFARGEVRELLPSWWKVEKEHEKPGTAAGQAIHAEAPASR
ncbi:helicase C-terminal domain-containing protein [Noviherbaspirillum sp. CPCC 100848]|uniref:Helicase C-terminal domain-containing protein n=1 Tax=Noviherbaspirillum album TaxID=3080276 RepID=A0ABU6JFH9_9BURK|nr:helicase C-terminal domain-containing protein [Noviherbaspirillum sp. CPCC 100848]MEC4722035.1 helicase C-terminal domain-containing protein [Noviherbaspirillum sp. CPCC 100848]